MGQLRHRHLLHPVGPQVLAGLVLWALEDGPEVLRFYREFVAAAPREVNTVVALRKAPRVPFLPPELHGRPVCAIAAVYLGDPAAGEKALAPLREFGSPLLDHVDVCPYTGLQSMFDATVPHGWRYYWKSAQLGRLDDAVIDAMIEYSSRIRPRWTYSVTYHLGGVVGDVEEDATAYSHRAAHVINMNGVWLPGELFGDEETAWTQEFFTAVGHHRTGAYVNVLDRDDQARVRTAY